MKAKKPWKRPQHVAVHLPHKGWFWVVPEGQKQLFYGPYRSEAEAKRKGPNDYMDNDPGGAGERFGIPPAPQPKR